MKIILTSLDSNTFDLWNKYFSDLDNVSIVKESILDVAADAIVSPANSFGFMDGGLDRHISNLFGWHVEENLRKQINEWHHGELLVGNAEIVETGFASIPFLIAAPTMRVPMPIKETVNVYLAARAVFLLINKTIFKDGVFFGEPVSNYVKTVAFPAMGTGIGELPMELCARQIRKAYEDIIVNDDVVVPASWKEGESRHDRLIKEFK